MVQEPEWNPRVSPGVACCVYALPSESKTMNLLALAVEAGSLNAVKCEDNSGHQFGSNRTRPIFLHQQK